MDTSYEGFNFTLVQPILKDVKEALQWEDVVKKPLKTQHCYFKNGKREGLTIPLMDEFKSMIKDKWRQPEKNTFFSEPLGQVISF